MKVCNIWESIGVIIIIKQIPEAMESTKNKTFAAQNQLLLWCHVKHPLAFYILQYGPEASFSNDT